MIFEQRGTVDAVLLAGLQNGRFWVVERADQADAFIGIDRLGGDFSLLAIGSAAPQLRLRDFLGEVIRLVERALVEKQQALWLAIHLDGFHPEEMCLADRGHERCGERTNDESKAAGGN